MKDTSMNAEICRQNLEDKWNGWRAPKYPCIKRPIHYKGKELLCNAGTWQKPPGSSVAFTGTPSNANHEAADRLPGTFTLS